MIEILSRLAAEVERALKPLGFAPEKRRFRPHLTIGRPKDPRAAAAATAEKIEQLRGFGAPATEARALALIKSTLTPEGAMYEVVRRFELGAD